MTTRVIQEEQFGEHVQIVKSTYSPTNGPPKYVVKIKIPGITGIAFFSPASGNPFTYDYDDAVRRAKRMAMLIEEMLRVYKNGVAAVANEKG